MKMHHILKPILIILLIPFIGLSQGTTNDSIDWLSLEEVYLLNEKNPKKIYMDFYTDWCGYCKKMDKTTFRDTAIVRYINENFYPVKFNAEQKEDIEFNGRTFKYITDGRRGVNELTMSLLNMKLGYPSFVILDEEYTRILVSPGFKYPPAVMKELEFAVNELYKQTSWDNYRQIKE